MARFNEILVGRYNRLFQKLFAVKGTAPVPVLSTEIQPVVSVFSGGENRYLEGWKLLAASAVAPAVAGQTCAHKLRNPAGSNVIAVVPYIGISTGVAQEIDLSIGSSSTDLTTYSPVALDSRTAQTVSGSSAMQVSSTSNAPFPLFVIARPFVPANTQYDLHFDNEIPLLPGSALQINATVANSFVIATWFWRERALEESEQT